MITNKRFTTLNQIRLRIDSLLRQLDDIEKELRHEENIHSCNSINLHNVRHFINHEIDKLSIRH